MSQTSLPLVAIIGCGGTISTVAAHSLDFIEYLETGKKIEPGEIVARVKELANLSRLEPVPFRSVSSSAIGPNDWLELARTIDGLGANRPDIRGIVILHGTATLEETAYFLNLTLKSALPVVVTGAQRPLNVVGSDAAINLIAAVRVAIDPQAVGKGVLVVLNDEVHQARDVTKTSTYRLSAFKSPGIGPIGIVDADRVIFYREPTFTHTRATDFHISLDVTELPRVDIAYSYAGADDAAIEAYIAAGARGIVSAGFAPGMPTPKQRSALEAAARRGILIVQASRAGSGRVARRAYLKNSNWIAAGDLNPQKARVLLMLALMNSADANSVQSYFNHY